MAALAWAFIKPPKREQGLAKYLNDDSSPPFGLNISLEVFVNGNLVSSPPFASMYWTAAQMLAHMTVNGASLRSGDFFASGTVSGPEKDQRGSFLELSWNGTEPLILSDGRDFRFLEDGNEIVIRATAPGPSGTPIEFGEVSGRIHPAT
jgi:fumarylacetoacetase